MTKTSTLPADDAWRPWHPFELDRHLQDVQEPWCIVGGWALDLWHGRQTRDHDDIEFSILRGDVNIFRDALSPLQFCTAGSGMVEHLPPHQQPQPQIFQIWCLDAVERCWRADMMLEPGDAELWVYRRDERIRRPRRDVVATTTDGLHYLKPEVVLLFKAKHMRAKDEADFASALPRMETSERRWLKQCLDLVHPGHPWAGALSC